MSQYDVIKETFYLDYFIGKRIMQQIIKNNCHYIFQHLFSFTRAGMMGKFIFRKFKIRDLWKYTFLTLRGSMML